MAKNDNSVIFLKDWKLLISSLSTENQLYFWELFTDYEYESNQECNNEFVKPIWNFIKSQLDNMKDKYISKTVITNRENGKLGGRPKKTQPNPDNPMGFSETQITPKDKDNNNNNEKNKDKEEYIIPSDKSEKLDFDLLLKYLNKKTGRSYRVVPDKVKIKYKAVLKQGYTKEDIKTAIDNSVKAKNHIDNNFQYLTMEFFSRTEKLDMYSAKTEPKLIEGETLEEKARREYIENFKNIKIH